uniref:Uncharacterized protein n=1 Tax=Arundo donax TaxID=35708 RepID=A0A0A9FBY0_ARUDO
MDFCFCLRKCFLVLYPRFTLPVKPLEPLGIGMMVTAKTPKTVRFTAQNSKSEFG